MPTKIATKPLNTSRKIQIRLYSPHAAQWKVHQSKARHRVVASGRQVGKTLFAVNELTKFGTEHNNVNTLWVSPVYRQCKVVYRLLKRALKDIITYHSDSDLRLEFVNGWALDFYSGTNADAMRGNKYHFVIMDECADLDEDVWTNVVSPTLATTNGRVVFLGTPKGQNWFFFIFNRGNDPLQTEWESFTFPTSANPYVSAEFIEQARKTLPEANFEQEFLAVFHAESAGVFRGINRCISGELEEVIEGQFYISVAPQTGIMYTVGWDIAKYKDFSVMTVMNCNTNHVDAWYRTNMVDYTEQIKRLKFITEMYNNAYVLQDSTGVGDPVLEMVKGAGITAEGYLYNNTSKKQLIEGAQLAIEHVNVTFPNIPVLIGELRTMQYKMLPSRLISYEAPKGYFDDAVNSLALSIHASSNGGPIPIEIAAHDPELMPVKDYANDELLERQLRIQDMLSSIEGRDVELVATFGG